jgi:DNA modification methylase
LNHPELGKVYHGDCLSLLWSWEKAGFAEFVDATVTSPPYWGLRSYLPEDSPLKSKEVGGRRLADYLLEMEVLAKSIFKITKPTGTFWLNIGDTWCNSKNKKLCPSDSREGECLDVPHRLASVVRSCGWRLVVELVWNKPNSNPHFSGRHPIYSHESVFMFTKTADHYYDGYAIQEKSKYQHEEGRTLYSQPRSVWTIPTTGINGRRLMSDFKTGGKYMEVNPDCPLHGNDQLIWIEAPRYPECTCKEVDSDFFAAMPVELASRLIKCSTSDKGNCEGCGKPYTRFLARNRVPTRPGLDVKVDPAGKAKKDPQRHVCYTETLGWTGCPCAPLYVPPIVFDPFMGAGTTALAAEMNGRDWLGCELNPVLVDKLIPARIRKWRSGK